MIALLLAGLVACVGPDDTALIQAAVDAGDVSLAGACLINGRTGVRIPGDRDIDASRAMVSLVPGCSDRCRAFETIPGAHGVRFIGGELVGSQLQASGWQIGFRVDTAADVEIIGTTFTGWKSDGVWIGGNTPSTGVRLSGVTVEGSGRNGISITNAVGVTVERCALRDTRLGADPGAGLDAEPSAANEGVHDLTVIDTEASGNAVGLYMQIGKGQPGTNYKVLGCRLRANRTHGLILNSVHRALVADNDVTQSPLGISVGSHTEEQRAVDVTVIGNRVSATRAIVLAGVRDSRLLGNGLAGGRVEAAALGMSGNMTLERNGN